MWKKAKRFLAVLVALTLVLSVVDKDQLFVSASATSDVQPDAGGETDADADNAETDTDTGNVETGAAVEEQAEETDVMEEDTVAEPEASTEEVGGENNLTETNVSEENGSIEDETPVLPMESGETGSQQEGTGQTEGNETTAGTETVTDESADTGEQAATGEENSNTEPGTELSEDATGEVADEELKEDTAASGVETVTGTETSEGTEEAAAAEEETTEEEAGSATYAAKAGEDGQEVNVIVEVPEGAFDAEAEPVLHAEAISGEDELNEVAAQIEEQTGTTFDGMVALDVYFTNGDSEEEIEPALPVSVRFELPESALPEGMDASTMAVHHLAESTDENGETAVTVETVAAAAEDVEGVVALSDAAAEKVEASGNVARLSELDNVEETVEESINDVAVVTEFEVESFSTFTLTYLKMFNVDKLSIMVVNADDEEIGIWNGEGEIETSWISVDDISDWIMEKNGLFEDDYTFSHAEIRSLYSDSENVQWIKYKSGWDSGFRYSDNENRPNGDGKKFSNSKTLYFVFDENTGTDPDVPGPGVVDATVTTQKTAYLKDDDSGHYDLTLTITGDRGQIGGEAVPVDILFILDESGSMDYTLTSDQDAEWWEQSRMDLLETSAKTLIDTIEKNEDIDARYSAVSFSRAQWGETKSWTDVSGIREFIEDLQPDGGTNYQKGIYDGKTLLKSARKNALTFVIFVSDGEPTYRGVDVDNYTGDYWYGNGQNDDDGKNIAAAVREILGMSCTYFYAIGMGPEFGTDQWGSKLQGTLNLENLANNVNAAETGVYSANNTEDLEQAFVEIATSVTFFSAKNVQVMDPLSNYADLVLNDNGKAEFTITVKREEGNKTWTDTVESGETLTFQDKENRDIIVTARTSQDGRTIYLDFPEDYELEEGYSYSISTVIKPSEEAISADMDSQEAKQTPDEGTGTHADREEVGFWSNQPDNDGTEEIEGAKVTYTANDSSGEAAFPQPVIRVQDSLLTGNLSIEKKVEGPTGDDQFRADDLKFIFEIIGPEAVIDKTYGSVSFNTDRKATVEVKCNEKLMISGLPLGTYNVIEIGKPETADGNYYCSNSIIKVGDVIKSMATVEAGKTATFTVTNTYAKYLTVTITKEVTGDMGDTSKAFDFTTSVSRGAYINSVNESSVKNGSMELEENGKPGGSVKVVFAGNVSGDVPTAVLTSDGYTLADDDKIVLSGLKVDDILSISEIGVADEGYTVSYKVDSKTLSNPLAYKVMSDANIVVTNNRPVVAPTGMESSHTTPYTLMTGISALAGLALAGSLLAYHKRRRHQE